MTILHVEDDENDAILLAKACERARLPALLHRVADAELAKSYLLGEGAYADRLKYPVPQIIILDLKLPRVSGFDFLIWFRQQPAFAGITILIFTASLSRDDKSRALSEGASSYFVKPASFEALVQMVGVFRSMDTNPLN
ncbi:MAG TPA: response regulator [Candidatus Paceibacterota bacterium]|nr:response regulator [Candidatus Paceibacterota bacterium]